MNSRPVLWLQPSGRRESEEPHGWHRNGSSSRSPVCVLPTVSATRGEPQSKDLLNENPQKYKIHSLYAEGHSEYRDEMLWAPDSGTRALFPDYLCRLPVGHSLSSHLENQSDSDRLHCACVPSILILLNNGLKVQGAVRLRFPSVSQRRPFLVYYFV